MAVVVLATSGCKKKETTSADVVSRQCAIIWDEIKNKTGIWGERANDASMMCVNPLDIDGDGIKEVLVHLMCRGGERGWWLLYYRDEAWHEASPAPFMHVYDWETYYRNDEAKNLPRLFYKKSGKRIETVSAVIFDKEKGTVTLEPFDFQEFQDLKKRGVLIYEDAGQDDW